MHSNLKLIVIYAHRKYDCILEYQQSHISTRQRLYAATHTQPNLIQRKQVRESNPQHFHLLPKISQSNAQSKLHSVINSATSLAIQRKMDLQRMIYNSGQMGSVIQLARRVNFGKSKYAAEARKLRRGSKIGGKNIATASYRTKVGKSKWSAYSTITFTSSGTHSEKNIYDYLESLKVDYEVNWLFTELAPCGSDFHNCERRVGEWFPNASVYYSIDYPSYEDVSSESSDDEKSTKKRKKAKRRRRRGPMILKRFETKLRNDWDSSDDEPEFNPPLRPINSPLHYSGNTGIG